ncbi:PAS domain-containing sensor histidine kinase [Virgibacillus indicus]|uniref:histidine kinase n=1 Tax=Virgibacillus indicus TaxID=2024554 RepID=A0A265NEG7_9BACI|nr:ATP-binding protein [Virgibacillus indicus]OZU90221.1 PAS domain-containing sensor histidine kinase [Virgibacillus indicus]
MGYKKSNSENNTNEPEPNKTEWNRAKGHFPELSALPQFMMKWIENYNNDVITVWDRNGEIIFISESIERLFGYRVSELLGTYWYEKISSEDLGYIMKYFDQEDNNSQRFSINIMNKQGKYIWTECTTAKIVDKNSGQAYFISILKDITDKKENEEMMVRSEKMSVAGQLAAGIAHEIRNPLTSLKGFLQLMQAGVNRKEEYYKIMIDEIEKIETITTELLFISKPLTDNKKVESVSAMLDDVIALLSPQAKLNNIEIKKLFSEDVTIYCDRSQLKQVFINLFKNAIEAMNHSGTIKLQVSRRHPSIEIDVIDEGVGISEEIIHKLGEPFFTTKQTGTGLGIMITKQILERHNATLEIKRNPDIGSTFRIIFPAKLD